MLQIMAQVTVTRKLQYPYSNMLNMTKIGRSQYLHNYHVRSCCKTFYHTQQKGMLTKPIKLVPGMCKHMLL